jgi:SOS response regulatory protein OraA/RecX
MKIEKLVTTPDRSGRYRVEFHDGTVMRLYRQTVEDYGLYSGKEFTEEEFSKFQNDASALSAKMRAVRIVSASSVSARDLRQRLIHKGEEPDQAAAAVQWMQDLDLLDDRKTAEQIVDRCARQGYGIARAKQMLYEKQIPKALWDDVLSDYPSQTDKIAEFLRVRLGNDWDQKSLKRAIDAAMRRGHSYPEIRKALTILQADTDDFPEEW